MTARIIPLVRSSFDLSVEYLRRLVADLDAHELVVQPNRVANHGAWTIGHVVYSCQLLCGELGCKSWLPEDWGERFGTGSRPGSDATRFPSKSELLTALELAKTEVHNALEEAGEKLLDSALPDEKCRTILPTIGHALVHVLLSHLAMHVGQLAVWRRACGYSIVKEPFG